jgi:hypothetical protein
MPSSTRRSSLAIPSIAALATTILVLAACSGETPRPPLSKPETIVKTIDGQPVTFGMVDGAHGAKVFFRMDDAYQCNGDSCDPCANGGCIINGGCPCALKECAFLCQPGAALPVPEEAALMLTSKRADVIDALQNRDAFGRRVNELENRIRDLETGTPRR